ncbi:transcription factor Adf-1-like [Osmia bicornis bicornis]|uniref:transcription factor Adf-1-like n=1 Tax=Osmia bicornis bicornis TaxID=1437191 RepID=UPI001EAF45CF|nr:transcription factor Adf-1-like [Osmia bicornis bicornis]
MSLSARFLTPSTRTIFESGPECVRKYPVLYDMTHVKYLDSKSKYSIWKSISKEMNLAEDICKKRWSNIRDQFKKHRNKRKAKSGQSALHIKKYKHEDTLQFLLPHEEERNTISNIESTENSEQTQVEIEIDEPDHQLPVQDNVDTVPSNLSSQNPSSAGQFVRSQKRYRRTMPKSAKPTESASNTLMTSIMENNVKQQKDIHPIDAFFSGLAPTIKRFSPYHQHVAKGKIFAIVQELEWEQLSTEPCSFVSGIRGESSPNDSSTPTSSPNDNPTPKYVPTTPTPPMPATTISTMDTTFISQYTLNND